MEFEVVDLANKKGCLTEEAAKFQERTRRDSNPKPSDP